MADTTNNNVFFKKGSQSSLNTLATVTNGAFYLTEDTHRLYIGQNDDLVLLNQSINFISVAAGKTGSQTLVDLGNSWGEEKAYHINEVYYVLPNGTDGNILAIWTERNNNYSWTQINPDTDTDTKIDKFIKNITADSNTATVSMAITSTDTTTKSASFTIEGNEAISISKDSESGNIVIEGDTYSIAAENDGNNSANFVLSSALGQEDKSIKIVGGDNVSITTAADGSTIEISSTDTNWVPVAGENLSSLQMVNGQLVLKLKDANGQGPQDINFNEAFVKVGVSNPTAIPFGGSLGVYTASEVDAKIDAGLKGLNGMTYRGTVSHYEDNLATSFYINENNVVNNDKSTITDVSQGDMLLVVCEKDISGNSIPFLFNGIYLTTGDLIIATGDSENSNGFIDSGLSWTVVPSGNDNPIDTQYKFRMVPDENKIELSASSDGITNTAAGAFTLEAGNNISIVSNLIDNSDTTKLNTIISHEIITTNRTDNNESVKLGNGASDIPVVENITVSNGHVTALTTKKISLPSYTITNGTKSITNGQMIGYAITETNTNNTLDPINFGVVSETLKISNKTVDSTPSFSVELEWGTF